MVGTPLKYEPGPQLCLPAPGTLGEVAVAAIGYTERNRKYRLVERVKLMGII